MGSVIVVFEKAIYDGDCEVVKITVEDTGVGIPEHIKNNLFKKFSTFNHSNNELNR